MADVAETSTGCGANCGRVRQPLIGCSPLWGAVVAGQVEDRQGSEGVVMKLQKGDVVRLAESVTMTEFGLALCDNDGVGLEIDGVVVEAMPHMVNVRIRRLMTSSSICGPTEGAGSRSGPPQREGNDPSGIRGLLEAIRQTCGLSERF